MLAVFVVFTSTVDSCTNAVYVGGLPEAEHENLKPGKARTKEADNSTLGGATGNKKNEKKKNLTSYAMHACNSRFQEITFTFFGN